MCRGGQRRGRGDVAKAVILAVACGALTERDVELPVQSVFDGPMSANRGQQDLGCGVCQRGCPPISCGVSDFRVADFVFGVEPERFGRFPVASFS